MLDLQTAPDKNYEGQDPEAELYIFFLTFLERRKGQDDRKFRIQHVGYHFWEALACSRRVRQNSKFGPLELISWDSMTLTRWVDLVSTPARCEVIDEEF